MSNGHLPLAVAFTSGNRLLDALPLSDRIDLEADLVIVTLAAHKFTHSVGGAVAHIDFPIDAVLSVVATLENGDTVEVGTVGSEGFVESDAVLGSTRSPRTSFCQVRGTVGRMSIGCFEARMANSDSFARLMRRNVSAALFSAQQFAACNLKHSILQRCARWLSMTEDRVGNAEFTLTHEFLAIMLGERYANVSEATDALQTMGAITYRRGAVKVLDQQRLNVAACECYEACKLAFDVSLRE
ncbi:MAG TPA: Crp/Fnr family transcriptional regulator [Candidatus Aquilonibacter sp.]